jgi:hypothetical protein
MSAHQCHRANFADGRVSNLIQETSAHARAANLHELQSLEHNTRLVNALVEFLYDNGNG